MCSRCIIAAEILTVRTTRLLSQRRIVPSVESAWVRDDHDHANATERGFSWWLYLRGRRWWKGGSRATMRTSCILSAYEHEVHFKHDYARRERKRWNVRASFVRLFKVHDFFAFHCDPCACVRQRFTLRTQGVRHSLRGVQLARTRTPRWMALIHSRSRCACEVLQLMPRNIDACAAAER